PPVPKPLPADLKQVLSSNKVIQWNAAESAFNRRDWPAATQLYLDFLEGRTTTGTKPMADRDAGIHDWRFRPMALFRRAFAYEQQGETNLAINAYNDVLNGFNVSGAAVADSGVSYCTLAALKIMDLAHDDVTRLPEEWRENPAGLAIKLDGNGSPFDVELHSRLKAIGTALATALPHGQMQELMMPKFAFQ